MEQQCKSTVIKVIFAREYADLIAETSTIDRLEIDGRGIGRPGTPRSSWERVIFPLTPGSDPDDSHEPAQS
jgi:hypothetical protein